MVFSKETKQVGTMSDTKLNPVEEFNADILIAEAIQSQAMQEKMIASLARLSPESREAGAAELYGYAFDAHLQRLADNTEKLAAQGISIDHVFEDEPAAVLDPEL